MEISSSNSNLSVNAYLQTAGSRPSEAQSQQKTDTATAGFQSDRVELSGQAKEVQQAMTVLKEMPEIRTELVDEISTQVDKGTYTVNGEKTAGHMLDEAFMNAQVMKRIDLKA
ncbi:MAG: flagellar biosynthesis anti-sigma factor FlgM [Desulfosarcinaceae bacterium]|nr:flagellar biosynthesis anti-sigma factor FlgM [Desulfosarcinaceae bacterium]